MKTKTLARIFSFLLAFCLVAQLVPAVPAAVAAEGDTITYTFSGIPGAATIEANNWELNYWLTDQGIAINRNVTGWFLEEAYSKLYLTDAARDSIAYNLNVPADGNYNVTITTNNNAPIDYNINVNRKTVGKITAGAKTHVIENVPFTKGLNTFQIKITADTGSTLDLSSIKLDWVSELEAEAFTLNFKADTVATTYENVSFANQGIRVNKQTVSAWSNAYNQFKHPNNSNYPVIGFGAVDKWAALDFMADEAGTYDLIVGTEDNTNHSIYAEVYMNGATKDAGTLFGVLDNAALTSNKDRTNLIKTALGTTYNNIEALHLVPGAPVKAGYNTLHFKSVSGSQGVMNLYFRKNISLIDTKDTAVATSGIEAKTFAAKNDTATATVTAPKRGIYYLYIKAKSNDNAFGGYASITQGQAVTQYIDFTNGYYDNEAANSVVTRVIGPIWLDAKEYPVTFTELIGTNTTLALEAIELHEVKQNMWMTDNTNQDFGGVSIDTHGWELDKDTTDETAYAALMNGGLYGETYYNGYHRNAYGTSIQLSNARAVGFKFNIPVAGTYKITGNFKHRSDDDYACNNAIVGVKGTGLEKILELNVGGKNDTWSEEEIGVVNLKAGENTIMFYSGEGGRNLCMENLTFTPYEGATGKGVDVTLGASEITVGAAGTTATATVKMSDDSAAPEGTTVTWKSSDTKVATVDAATGAITAVGAGEATITATANILGVNYTGSAKITVKAAPVVIPESDVFGSVYAYVKDGTVYFLGGLKAIEGYTEVGFEVTVNGEKVDDIKTSEVFKSFKVKDQTVNASDWASSYIFITSTDELNAGDKVVVKPYVSNGTAKIYHEGLGALELDI